jgi:para-nitrobenzyl esterase
MMAAHFARQGIVCITVAYRLGVFGFLEMEPALGREYAGSANNGTLDLIAALEWVRDNVASFGGDPGRVTIGGESAGAKLSDLLMGVPKAAPLFHQVISESGGAERVWPTVIANGIGQGFADAWQKTTSKTAAELLTSPAESIVPVQKRFMEDWPQHFPLRPEIDGRLMSRLPVQEVAGGSSRGKRLLIGTNREESALFIGTHPEHDPTAQNLGNLNLTSFLETYARYKSVYPEMTDELRRIRAVTAEEYWVPTIRLADAHVKAGGTAWMYELAFSEASGRFSRFAYHSLDVGLVWEKPHGDVSNATAEAALAVRMHEAWVAFIRGDAPAATGLPLWTEFRPETRATMILDTVSRVEQRPQEVELRLWERKL